jgi:transcriptional regulator with XRE-family HTH domain
MDLPQAVRDLRAFTGDTQQRFGHRLAVSLRAIANYEQGRTPNAPVLYRLGKVARQVGRPDLAELFSRALSEELHIPIESMTSEEKAWSDATLAVLRSPQLSDWPQIARVILAGLEKLVQQKPNDQKLAEILVEARYTLMAHAEQQLHKLALECQRETDLTYAKAYTKVLMDHPELYHEYQEARHQAAQGTMFEASTGRPDRGKPKRGH